MITNKNFIILTTQRTGSTWLGTLLDSHPDVKVYGELFLSYDVPEKYQDLRRHDPDKFFRFKKENKGIRPWITWNYLDHVFDYHSDQVGSLKLMIWPLIKHFEILFYLKGHKIPVIILKRNLKDRVFSYALAEERESFHKLEEDNEKIPKKISLDPKKIKKIAKRYKKFDYFLHLVEKYLKK
ncbi:MAG: sulfotransferase, partial [Pseudomonadota bacterium]